MLVISYWEKLQNPPLPPSPYQGEEIYGKVSPYQVRNLPLSKWGALDERLTLSRGEILDERLPLQRGGAVVESLPLP
jgi:hypothetical protein